MDNKDNLYIVMPAYNEADNIENVIHSWYPVLNRTGKNSRIVVADSGSVDDTHILLKKLQNKYSNLLILSNTPKEHGPKVLALYRYAIQNGADLIFQTDSDGQTNPEEFHGFWDERNQYDAILGERLVRGDGISRKLVENVLCFLLHIYFGIHILDANAPFRLMRTEIVAKYLDRMPADYALPNVMMTVYFAFYREKLKFVPISFKARKKGNNSVNFVKIVKIGWKALHEFFQFRKRMIRTGLDQKGGK